MRVISTLIAAGLLAAPVAAAAPDRLSELVRGKTAGTPRRCIFPDRSVQPVIIDGTAIVYRDARFTYVGRLKGGCPALREGRTIVTRSAGGQLCQNDPVRVVESTGAGFGICTFETFTPYLKAR